MTPPETPASFTDIPDQGWVARHAPTRLRPYLRLARLDRPIGTWLLLWPCWWSIAMASNGQMNNWPDFLWLLAAFALGALVMRGAGCAWNDITDRDFDGQVERTRGRPIPSGEISIGQAAAFMVLLALIGLNILLRLNTFALWIGVMSLAPVVIYPFMKRITWWPQVFLGLAFNWGALLGWAAVRGELTLAPLLLYLGGIAWTLGYDTIYAHQDKMDDALIGIKSSARALGQRTRPMLWAFYGAAITLFALAGWLANLGPLFFAGVGVAAAQLAWQAGSVDIDDPGDCLAKFRSNTWFGWLVFAAVLLGIW
ncbi:MAG: 4-hydroxybenzoate octaprenyltransferase [Rhodospirillaceae bacterium]|jgi:4-hydroxybenzoate polyprenyltransferase|nr:4-hydroxybenzoate octaprenyltransferase [Rhodospirillaceae bacterium]MBT4042953.1 4-hydroxybenzoate octaprenyltransferase [Rhodospirillaceae bacterium]MBT4687805.1 4-hydroxybenzoate octaprenyltransferase [Rhodospirillaceae bacterium]MBT5082389.1 4-hydroxybenzoate octaprenyltransferase [Rhodospirillaceae bacterium]MBT5524591.1 4-hydroxybenzoate octaprenyltransferase [Rhodospirillaceae bacterium]